jgi:hypothetical protein
MKKRLAKRIFSVGVSNKRRYLVISKKLGVHDDYVTADPEKLPFKEQSFDIAFLSGLLEYLSREKGEHVLKTSEKVARRNLIRVPCSGSPADAMHLVFEGGFVLERSNWEKSDFKAKQYKTVFFGIKGIFPCTLYAYKKVCRQKSSTKCFELDSYVCKKGQDEFYYLLRYLRVLLRVLLTEGTFEAVHSTGWS